MTPMPRVALVTGGARGIGEATSRSLAEDGAHVVIADVDPAGASVAEAVGGRFVHCDVSQAVQVAAAVDVAVDAYGRLDVAVLCAGLGETTQLSAGFDPEEYRRMAGVNLDGVVFGLHAALRGFGVTGSGSVVVVASLAGLAESPYTPLYAATKHAVVGLVRSVAPGLERVGVRINAVCPAFVDTPMIAGMVRSLRAAGIPVLSPQEVAIAIGEVLASGRTGQAWPVVRGEPFAPFEFATVPDILADVTTGKDTP